MTVRNLQIFLEVAKTGSMSRAAESLYVSQPTISHAIACLEKEYNTQLFDRFPSRLQLTQTGRLLVQEAQSVMQALLHLQESMTSLDESAFLTLGVSVTVAESILDPLTKSFHRLYPKMQVKVRISNTSDIAEALENNEVDLAIVSGEIHNPLIETRDIIEDCQVCVCRSDHPLAGKGWISLAELSREKFVMLFSNRWTRTTFDNYVHDQGCSLNIVCECANTLLVKERVLKGDGVAVVSARVIERELLSGELSLIHCKGCAWKKPFIIAYRKQKYLSQPLQDFIDIAENYTDQTVLHFIERAGVLS